MNRFATHLRVACILAVLVCCWMVSKLVPSPYDGPRSMSADRTQVSAPEPTDDDSMLRTSASEIRGIEVDVRRLTFVSRVS